MAKISVLPPDLRSKIAAGEVIERPASVVKELIENALDADCDSVRIEVWDGGRKKIIVSDNGAGMSREDAAIAFQRHATSKILKFDDLYSLSTMGFRGEALASIASVSRILLTTAERGARNGISLTMEGGEIKESREAAATGTVLEVKDLFYNTPARKKFLKKTPTELFHIIDTTTQQALAHPETGFSLFVDGAETMQLPRASGLRERIVQIYGIEFMERLVEVEAEEHGLLLHAFISEKDNFRATRSHQYLFINHRPVRDPSLSRALYQAYEGLLPPDKHPLFFISLEMQPDRVDFNVHPTKKEVRFADKEHVYRFLRGAFRRKISGIQGESASDFRAPLAAGQGSASYSRHTELTDAGAGFGSAQVAEHPELGYRTALPFIHLGDSFIGLAGKGGLMLIDHHAAHERVLFERLLSGMKTSVVRFLFPKQVRLGVKEHRALLDHQELLGSFGIEIDDFGDTSIVVRAVPQELADTDLEGILTDAAAGIVEGNFSPEKLKTGMAARIACHSSVRGSRMLTQEELTHLLDDLDAAQNPEQCPHGRPTRIFYSLYDLKKLFHRV